ncbi:MAG: LuxR C-terminal-related transcriptional regulator [Odoribacter sp.]
MREGNKTEPEIPDSEISDREMEILYHVCLGFLIRKLLISFISKRTVDKHRANLLSKTGCRNTAALVMYAIKNKMINV